MSDHEDTDGVRQGYVLGLSASEGMDYLVSGPMFDRWLESVKDEAFDDGFYAGSELGYTPERKGDTMSKQETIKRLRAEHEAAYKTYRMHNTRTPPLPDSAVAPGEFIQEWLDGNNVNAAELARRLDVTPKHVSELLSGKATVSPTLSLALERVTGTPARLWIRSEALYREDIARLAEQGHREGHFAHRQLSYDAGYAAGVTDTERRIVWMSEEAYNQGYVDGSLSHTASDYALGYEAGYRDGVVDRGRRFVGKAADTQ